MWKAISTKLPGITKYDRLLLQSVSGIATCDKPLLQSVLGITKRGRQLLQVSHNSLLYHTKCPQNGQINLENLAANVIRFAAHVCPFYEQ